MPRVARIVIPGMPHHVTQRGNNRQDVFFVDDDRRKYLALLKQESVAHGLQLLGYCLMRNHVHLVAIPREEQSLARAVGRTDFLYTQYINRMHGRSGHLWQNRFYSCALDEVHLWRAMAYIERNAVRAKTVRLAWNWPWSSATVHLGMQDAAGAAGLLDLGWFREEWTPARWRSVLREPDDDEQTDRLRLATHRGRPLASDRWLARLETRLGRRVRPLAVGRPRKKPCDAPRDTRASSSPTGAARGMK